MSEQVARCEATHEGVMRAELRYRCGFADDGHDRHRARTEFGEVWWTAPAEDVAAVDTPAQEETAK